MRAWENLLLAVCVAGPLSATAQTTINGALTSNYVYRGLQLSDGAAAISGGLDWQHDNGAYAGGWISSVSSGAEVDLYVGYALQFERFGIDVGGVTYEYTDDTLIDGAFREVYAGGWFGPLSATIYKGRNTWFGVDYRYVEVGAIASAGISTIELHLGQNDTEGASPVEDAELSVALPFGSARLRLAVSKRDTDEDFEYSIAIGKTWAVD